MKHQANFRKTLRRVCAEANASRAFLYTWNALNLARGNPQLLAAIHHHNDFFRVSIAGNFRLFFLSLGRIFDRKKGTAALRKVKRHLCQNGRQDLADEIDQVYANHCDTIDRIRNIRNKSIAHLDPASPDKVLEGNQITPNQVEALIDELCDVLNRIRAELDC